MCNSISKNNIFPLRVGVVCCVGCDVGGGGGVCVSCKLFAKTKKAVDYLFYSQLPFFFGGENASFW